MSGVFLNFYQCNLKNEFFKIHHLPYGDFNTREKYKELRESYPNLFFYRQDDKIYYWKLKNKVNNNVDGKTIKIRLDSNPKIVEKIIETSLVRFLNGYRSTIHKKLHTWDIISYKDVLGEEIPGLNVYRRVYLYPYFFRPGSEFLYGFTLSSGLKHYFTWGWSEFEEKGIEIDDLDGREDKIFPDTKAVNRFLVSMGVKDLYDDKTKQYRQPQGEFKIIESFYRWLDKRSNKVFLPSGNSITNIKKRYLPYKNNVVDFEKIPGPEKYFYGGQTDTKNVKLPNKQVKTYKPTTFELFENKNVHIGVITPKNFEGVTEGILNKVEGVLEKELHINNVQFNIKTIEDIDLGSYQDGIYNNGLLDENNDIILVILSEKHEDLPIKQSPYYFTKAKLIGAGIPTQEIQVETFKHDPHPLVYKNLALNIYAKLGGTAWTVEKEQKRKDELVVGIGASQDLEGNNVLGFAQVFHADGRYLVGECSPLSTYENYSKNLEEYLYTLLTGIIESQINTSNKFRIIFHLFKTAGKEYEVKAINNLVNRLDNFEFDYSLLHLAYGHNFRLFYNDGKGKLKKGLNVRLDYRHSLLHFVPHSTIPLKISLDSRSTFKDLYYLTKQIYWFSKLSHRSYNHTKKSVTTMYPSIMAKITEELRHIEGWDHNRLELVKDKLWFI